jgi:hypothetical protein
MDTKELFVHDRRQWQRTERFHGCIVDTFCVFVFTFQLEGKIVCQVSAFMISPQQPETVGIPDLERPEIEDALEIR